MLSTYGPLSEFENFHKFCLRPGSDLSLLEKLLEE